MPWRYVKDNNYASINYPLANRGSRTTGELVVGLGSLMYHELTHANDFSPPAAQAEDEPQRAAVHDRARHHAELVAEQHLSAEIGGNGGPGPRAVFWRHGDRHPEDLHPSTIAGWFSADLASDNYNYSTPPSATYSREDIAMLMEEFYP